MCNQPFLQRKARKDGLELGQSTSLPLACLEMKMDYQSLGLDPLIDECAVWFVANKHKMKKHYTVL